MSLVWSFKFFKGQRLKS